MDPKRFRLALREARERTVKTQEALSAATANEGSDLPPIDTQTISNIERGATKDPSILTVARLIEAMGIRLSDFFLQIESPTYTHSTVRNRSDITTPPHQPAGGGEHGSGRSVSAAPAEDELDTLLIDVGNRLLDAIRRRDAAREQTSTAGTPRTKRVKGHRKSHR